jgi:ADP-heptose:LPS heptosyltransferase
MPRRDYIAGDPNRIPVLYPPANRLKAAGYKLLRRLRAEQSGERVRFADNPRFFVQSMGGLGNSLMATPFLSELRRVFPTAVIDLYTSPEAATLLESNPHVSRIIVDSHGGSAPQNGWAKLPSWKYVRSIKAAREKRYDAAFLTLNSIDLKNSLRPILAQIPVRVIHKYPFEPQDDFTFLFTHTPTYEHRHDCAMNLELIRAVTDVAVSETPMQLPVSDNSVDGARTKLAARGWIEGRPAIGICPGCRDWASDKRWPTDKYAQLSQCLLRTDSDLQILAFCGPHDLEEARILEGSVSDSRFHIVTGLELPEYAAALRFCALVVSNDSLPMHMCSALGIPVVAIFGPTDSVRVGPWMCPSRVIRSTAPYAPYFEMPYFCDLGVGDNCIRHVAVEDVLAAVLELGWSRSIDSYQK